jgi:hypothetical protein
MTRLFRLGSSGELIEAKEEPFSNETVDMEEFVKKNARILGDLIIFGEQIISAGRDKRIDLLGLNKDGDILIIELKNDIVNKDVLGQVFGYRNYWKRHVEAVKIRWNEFKEKPEGIEPDFSNFDPKILLVAPNFEQELLEIASLEHFPIEFVEIGRYAYEESTFVIVNRMEAPEVKVGAFIGRAQYDWGWYESDVVRSEIELKTARSLHDELIALGEKNGWKISPKFNKWYVAFKYGDRNVFTLEFKHKGKVAIVCSYLYEQSSPPRTGNIEWKWDKIWEYWYTEVEKPDFDLAQIESALAESYKRAIAA